MNIYLIRHGRQDSDLCNVNVGLHTIGKQQAGLLGRRFKRYDIDALYSSDLLRAIETAEILNQSLGVGHVIKKELREISFGEMEGKTEAYIHEHFAAFKTEQDKLEEDLPFPGGESGEDVCKRGYPVLLDIAKSGCNNVVVVTHGTMIRSLLAKIVGTETAKRFLFAKSLENCSITELRYSKGIDRFYLHRFNDYAHLEDNKQLLRSNY